MILRSLMMFFLAPALVAPWSGAQESAALEPPPKHVLRAGDRIQYRIAEDPVRGPAPLLVVVNSVGEVSFPVSRDSDLRITLLVRGKTVEEVREDLTRSLLADYYHRATVELTLGEKIVTPGRVQFFGEMSATLPLTPDTPPLLLSDAILQLGFTPDADLRRVKVHRLDPDSQQSRTLEINVRSILREGIRERDLILQDGDRVEVRTKWFN
ncbi:MAG: hypothetical protein KF833_22170 [Verrucomicrobiae bacterium]|nr:hypothetical protein [Verrucomicrobiae bacterium]